jgi:hypothetical protein
MLRAVNVKSCRASFADKLKDVAFQLYGWAGLKKGIYYETHYKEKEKVLPELRLSPRDIWIQMGNKMREIYADTWIDFVLKGVDCDVIIITDLRFRNEAKKLLERGATLVQIHRPGVLRGTDPAEVDLINWGHWDYIINNNGRLTDLNSKIKDVAEDLELLNG